MAWGFGLALIAICEAMVCAYRDLAAALLCVVIAATS
jgi:hypothetical protein